MDKDEARELNRQAKIDKWETNNTRECKQIGNILWQNNIEDYTFDDCFTINDMELKYGVELSHIDLELCSTVEEVIDALDGIR